MNSEEPGWNVKFHGKCDSPGNRASGQRLVPRALLPLKGLGNQAVCSKMLPGDKEDIWQTPSGLHSWSEKTDGAKGIEKNRVGAQELQAFGCS